MPRCLPACLGPVSRPNGALERTRAKTTGSYQIDENGRRIAGGNAVPLGAGGPCYTRVQLSPKPAVISFALNAARTGAPFRLSTASRTVWTWRSAHETGQVLPPDWYCYNPPPGVVKGLPRHCVVQPMMTLRYQVAGMALDGPAPPGRQVLTVTAGPFSWPRPAASPARACGCPSTGARRGIPRP